MTDNFPLCFWIHDLHDKYLPTYQCATKIYECWCWISDIGQKIIPISDIMSDSAVFSPISDVLISGSVRYRWSRISDWVPTYVFNLNTKHHYARIIYHSVYTWNSAPQIFLQIDFKSAWNCGYFDIILTNLREQNFGLGSDFLFFWNKYPKSAICTKAENYKNYLQF